MHDTPTYEKALSYTANGIVWVGALGITGLMALTVVGVIWRYVLNDPIFGIGDVSKLTLIVVAACSVAHGAAKQAHVNVNVIKWFVGRGVTRFTDVVMRGLAVFIAALAAYALVTRACGFEKACITENLSIEHTVFYYILAVAMGFIALNFLAHLVTGLRTFATTDPNEPLD